MYCSKCLPLMLSCRHLIREAVQHHCPFHSCIIAELRNFFESVVYNDGINKDSGWQILSELSIRKFYFSATALWSSKEFPPNRSFRTRCQGHKEMKDWRYEKSDLLEIPRKLPRFDNVVVPGQLVKSITVDNHCLPILVSCWKFFNGSGNLPWKLFIFMSWRANNKGKRIWSSFRALDSHHQLETWFLVHWSTGGIDSWSKTIHHGVNEIRLHGRIQETASI